MSGRMSKIGDWNKVMRIAGALAHEMRESRKIALKRWGLKAEGLAKQHLSKQDLGWKELAPATLATKIRKGQSENILIATSDYFQAITSWATEAGAYAGVKKHVRYADGEYIADIARIHEFGLDNIPARPLWTPVMAETMEWYKSNPKNKPNEIFKERIKKYL